MKKRLGKFDVSDSIIDTPDFIEVLKRLKFVPYQVNQSTNSRSFEYLGTSIAFDLIEIGSVVPKYDIIVNTTYLGINGVTARKC